ncbi:L,D-transpeptidase [Aestuariivirga litoralis]|nr:L,D-transpeptidase [Aestuariivirga litoralis]
MQVDIVVDKVAQHMHVKVDGVEKYNWLVSTGGPGHETPSGKFHIFRFDKNHFSKEWDDAPMPNAMFFTALGHAIHGSSHISRLGTPASHGCVRLAPENAAILWDLVTEAGIKNNTVSIKGGLFDSQNLTTADTFKMSSDDLRQTASYDPGPRKSLFWWVKPQKRQEVDDQPSAFSKKKVAKDEPFSIFGKKKPVKKVVVEKKPTDKKAVAIKKVVTDKKVADSEKPAAAVKKPIVKDVKKKKLVPATGGAEG